MSKTGHVLNVIDSIRLGQIEARIVLVAIDVIGIDAVAAFAMCLLDALFHDLTYAGIANIHPTFLWPTTYNIAKRLLGELVLIFSPVFPGPGRKVADHWMAFLLKGLDCGYWRFGHIVVPHMVCCQMSARRVDHMQKSSFKRSNLQFLSSALATFGILLRYMFHVDPTAGWNSEADAATGTCINP